MKERYMAENTGEGPPAGNIPGGEPLVQNPSAELNAEPNVLISPQVEKVPKREPIELVKPDSGISPSVEAYRKMEEDIARQERPIEIRGQLAPVEEIPGWWPETLGVERWAELTPPARAVLAVNFYHNLPAVERRANEPKMKQAYDRIESYAVNDFVYSLPPEIADLKDQLAETDVTIVRQYAQGLQPGDPQATEKVGALRDKLHDLDTLKTALPSIENLLNLNADAKARLNITEQDWQNLADRRQNYTQQIANLEQETRNIVGQEFVDDRNQILIDVQNKERQLREVEEAAKQRDEEEKRDVEVDQELQLINEEINENLPAFAETLNFIREQRNLSETERDVSRLTQAETRLAWYFYQAKELGLTTDLEAAAKRACIDYKELPERVGMMQALNSLARDLETIQGRLVTERVWALRVLAARNRYQLPLESAKFNGIRAEYLERIQGQIEYQIQKILDPTMPDIQDMIDQGLIERLPGFNIQDLGLDQTLENRPHYQILYGTMVDLPGETEEDVDRGIDEYLDNLLYGSGAFDIQTVYGKMSQLGEAIERASLRLSFSELRPESSLKERSDFRDKWANKRRQTFNRVIFPLAQYSGNGLDAPNAAGLLKREAIRDLDRDGYESYREIIRDPDVLLAILKYYSEYKLYFTPIGHKGQLLNKVPGQYLIRGQIKELMIDEIMNQQFEGDLSRLTRRMTDLDMKTLFIKRESSLFKGLTLKQALDKATADFDKAETAEAKRAARKNLREAKREFYQRRREVQSKVNLAIAVLDAVGESAQLGAPSIIMDNGDYIRIDDMNLAGKFAILEEARNIDDTPALIRWRQRMWKSAWKDAGLDRAEARKIYENTIKEEYKKIGQTAPQFMFQLQEGFEETGLVTGEWKAFLDGWKKLRKDGYTAVLGQRETVDVTFEDILNMDELKPMMNNFMAVYTSASNILISPTAVREAKKGNDTHLLKTLKRLDTTGRAKFSDLDIASEEGKLADFTPEQIKELFEDAISDSFIFHATVRTLTRHMATRPRVKDEAGNFVYATKNPLIDPDPNNYFSSDRLDFGFPGNTWLFKRLRSLPEYWATNKRERVGRGMELAVWMDTHLTSLSEYLGCDNIAELIWNFNKGFVDQWVLTTFPEQILAAQAWRQFGETSINEENKVWYGILDKILTDSGKLFKVFAGRVKSTIDLIDRLDQAKKKGDVKEIEEATELFYRDYAEDAGKQEFKEQVDDQLEITLSRIQPLDTAQERSLAQFRSAGGAGVGRELNELLALKVAEWVISEKRGDKREEGGALSYDDIKGIMRIIMYRDTWRRGTSHWEERWGKMTSSRNPRLPTTPPVSVF